MVDLGGGFRYGLFLFLRFSFVCMALRVLYDAHTFPTYVCTLCNVIMILSLSVSCIDCLTSCLHNVTYIVHIDLCSSAPLYTSSG